VKQGLIGSFLGSNRNMAQLQRLLATIVSLGLITTAIAPFQPAIAIAQTPPSPTDASIQSLIDQGDAFETKKQYKAAIALYQQALKQFGPQPNSRLKGQVLSRIAMAYRHAGDEAAALPYFQQALISYRQGPNPLLEGITLRAIGLIYRNQNQLDPALEYLQAAQSILFQQPERYWQMTAWYDLGNLYTRREQYQQALESYQTALPIAQALNREPIIGELRYKIALSHHDLDQYAAAVEHYEASFPLLRAAQYHAMEANGYIQLGRAYNVLGQPKKALDRLETGLALARKYGQSRLEYLALDNLGMVYNGHGRPNQAEPYLTQALALAQQSQNQSDIQSTLGELGLMAQNRGNYAQAIAYLEQSLALAITLKDAAAEQRITNNLGITHYTVGDYAQAFKHYDHALKLARDRNDRGGQGKVLASMGILYRVTQNYPEALRYSQASLAIAESLKDLQEQKITWLDLGLLYDNMGQTPKAIDAYEAARKFAVQMDDPITQGKIDGNLGNLYEREKDYTKAAKFMRSSLAIAQTTGDLREQGVGLSNLGTILNSAGKFAEAEPHLRASIAIWDQQRAELNQNQQYNVADRQKINLFERQEVSYYHLQRSLVGQNRAESALEVAEQARTRALVEIMARKQTGKAVPLNEQPNINIDRLKQIAKAQNATIVEYSILRDWAKPNPNAAPKFEHTNLLIWVIQPNGQVTLRPVDLRGMGNQPKLELTQLVASSRWSIGVRGRKPLQISRATSQPRTAAAIAQPLQQLHQILIAPIQDLLPQDANQQVIFIPQDFLFTVPFYALQDAQGQDLIERHTIRMAPSIQVLGLTQTTPTDNPARNQSLFSQALIVGNPQMPTIAAADGLSEALADLPNAQIEAEQIAAMILRPALTGNRAKKSIVLAQMPQAKLIHFATHGLLDDFSGLGIPGAIALAPDGTGKPNDGLLTTDELTNESFKLQADLVVLSACNTGQSDIKGDGVIGLSRSFLAAGVPTLVVSLWSVDDASTAALMTEFYRNLQTTGDRAVALRQAMLKTRKTYPDTAQWAAFTLVGQP
jgi:CHAT domain-containing protein/tetratricopeptide (TPR) repeat protein